MAIKVSAINNMTSAKDSAILAFASDFLNAEGIPFLSANDLLVTEQSPNAMAVDVEKGYVYVQNDAWVQGSNQPKYYRVEIDTKTGKSLTPNASANNWIVAICIKVDVGSLTPGASGELAGTIEAIYGTAAASPVAPAIPNHHYVLAYATYNSSHSVITNARLTDLRTQAKMDHNKVIGQVDGWIPAEETWTYSSVDNPTGVFSISGDKRTKYSLGMRLKLTNGGNTIYGIITKIDYSAPNTLVTFLHEINPATNQALTILANSAITNPYYSIQKTPYNFPLNPSKWTISVTPSGSQASAVNGTWYNPGATQISIPIGLWEIEYNCMIYMNNSTNNVDLWVTISDANNTGSDNGVYTRRVLMVGVLGGMLFAGVSQIFETTTKVTRYLNLKSTNTGTPTIVFQQNGAGYFRVVCAYL